MGNKMHQPAKKFTALLLLGLLFGLIGRSTALSLNPPLIKQEQPMTVEELIDIALENHSAYRKAVEDKNFMLKGIKVAYAQFLPRVNLYANYSDSRYKNPRYANVTVVDPVTGQLTSMDQSVTKTTSNSWTLSMNQDLWLGGSRFYYLKRAQLMLSSGDLALASSRDRIMYEVKSAVFAFLANQDLVNLHREILDLRRESLRLAQARFATGDVIELDVMQAEIDVGMAENNLLTAEQNLEKAREALNLVIGADLESRYPINGDFKPVLPAADPEKLVQVALSTNPTYRTMDQNVRISEQDVKIAGANMLPTISLNGSLSRQERASGYNKFLLNPQEESRSVSLNLSWTVFNRFENNYRKQQSVVEKRKAMLDRRDSSQQISASVRNNWRDLTRLYEQLIVTEKNSDLARKQLELEQERYRLGATSQLNLRSAQVTFIQAENEHITKVYEFFTTRAALEQDLGRPLEEAIQ